jgi:anti-sigma-K factor RskA
MRYDDPQLLDSLAREYVLGTLAARSRARFARVLSFSLVARRAVMAWERRLAPLAAAAKPVEPPESAWAGIEAALGLARAPRARAAAGLWPALAAALAVVAVVFGGLYFSQQPSVERPAYVSVVTDAATGPVWLLQGFTESRTLRVSTVNPRAAPAGSSFELWMLPPPGGGNPVSLGLLPEMGSSQLGLSAAQLGVLMQTMTLAVSVEPAGGSPTGLPTGPVIFTAPLIRS